MMRHAGKDQFIFVAIISMSRRNQKKTFLGYWSHYWERLLVFIKKAQNWAADLCK